MYGIPEHIGSETHQLILHLLLKLHVVIAIRMVERPRGLGFDSRFADEFISGPYNAHQQHAAWILPFEVPHGNPRALQEKRQLCTPEAFMVKMLAVGWTIGLKMISQVEPLGLALRTANQAQGGVRDQDVYRLVVLTRGHTCEGG